MVGEEEDFFTVTRAVDYRIVHTWRIENFEKYFCSKCHLTSVHSHTFGHDEDPGTKWSLQFFPKGDKDSSSQNTGGPDMVSFFINLDKSSETTELPAKYSAVILGKESKSDDGREKTVPKVTGSNTFKRGSGWGRSKFMKLEELLKDRSFYLIDDSLSLRCTIEYTKHTTVVEKRRSNSVSSGTSARSTNSMTTSNTCANSSVTDVAKMLSGNNYANAGPGSTGSSRNPMDWHDVTFSVAGTQVHAHKWIVASGCPALGELIHKSNESVVFIDGAEPETFSEMIRFIYTGHCDFANFSCKLLAMAHRFRLTTLQVKCEEYLLSVLDKTNCFMMYSLGDLCSSSHLKTAATRMIETLGIMCYSNSSSNTVTIP